MSISNHENNLITRFCFKSVLPLIGPSEEKQLNKSIPPFKLVALSLTRKIECIFSKSSLSKKKWKKKKREQKISTQTKDSIDTVQHEMNVLLTMRRSHNKNSFHDFVPNPQKSHEN
jgi:hypothetical protein